MGRPAGHSTPQRVGGFTLVEVLVALMIVAIGLSALLVAVSGTARTSGYLRDKTLAQWIALNRLTEVRLNSKNKFAQNTDTAELTFGGRVWHYDTQYFDTSVTTMRRVVVRVYAGDTKTKGNPLAESTTFLGAALAAGTSANLDWNQGNSLLTLNAVGGVSGAVVPGTTTVPATTTPVTTPGTPVVAPTPEPQ